MLKRRIRHLQRYQEIAIAFSRSGLGFLVTELGLDEILSLPKRIFVRGQQEKHQKTIGERIRLFLEELGPTFVKMGQIASTRPDLLPADIIRELQKLQDQVSPFPFADAKAIIEQEIGAPLDEVFREFGEEPIGAASIGQVYYGELLTGEQVAVKVQRPRLEARIRTDLEILQELSILSEHRLDWAERYRLSDIVEEFSKVILNELDYTIEGRNADKFTRQFADQPDVRIPVVYWDYSTKKVLIMEYINGIKLNEQEKLTEQGYNTKVLAERLVQATFHQILIEGFYHGDPHPGNIVALPGEVIAYMDFGMVGRLTPDMKRHFASLVIAMMRQSTDGVIKAVSRMGVLPDDVNMPRLRADVDLLKEKYYDVPLSQVSLGEAVNELFTIAQQHQILIPADFTMLGKALLTIEGTAERLDPDISIVRIAEPFGRKLLKERFRPKRVAKEVVGQWSEYGELLVDLPKDIQEIKNVLKKGKVPLEITLPNVDSFLTKLDRISNRLSFSIVLLSFSIIMVGLIVGSAIGGQSSLLWNVPAVEIGFVVAIVMFFWLLFSIFRSGRF